ncbi:MAG: hypothetical protein RJA41_327, partial [Actinomycetota bacterium]
MKIREFIRQFLKTWRGSLTFRILLTSISLSV